MRFWIAAQILLLALLVPASQSRADALILADEIQYDHPARSFTATGNVKIYFRGATLHADKIEYANNTMTAEGQLSFTDSEGTYGVASFIELDKDFRTGVMRGVQMLIEDKVRVSSGEVDLNEGGLTNIRNAYVTTCRVCRKNEQPLWHFRARKVLHDKANRQLHMSDVDFYIGDNRVLGFPSLTVPDQTADRHPGFLLPVVSYSGSTGLWVRVPYFQTLGDSADITWTPGATTRGNVSLEAEHRRAFSRGTVTTLGQFLHDQDHADSIRNRFKFSGDWDIGNDFLLDFSVEELSDPEFLSDFGVSGDESVVSSATVTRRTPQSWFDVGTRRIDWLEDTSGTLPHEIHSAYYRIRMMPLPGAGAYGLSLYAMQFDRAASIGPKTRDVQRGSADLDWTHRWVTNEGLVVSATAVARFDSYQVSQDPNLAGSISRTSQALGVELRLPLHATGLTGSHVVEPFAQFVWSPDSDDSSIPNEDSLTVEFDETNLLSLNRFAGRDRTEQGSRLNLGLKHEADLGQGTSLELLVGRVFRGKDLGQFTPQSGLAGKHSDIVAAGSLALDTGLAVDHRMVFDEDFDTSKAETFFRYDSQTSEVAIGVANLLQDDSEEMTDDVDSMVLFAETDIGNNWAVNTTVEHDFNKEGTNLVGVGFEYRQDCLHLSISAEHYSVTETRLEADNRVNLMMSLTGFNDLDGRAAKGCGT